MLCSTSRLTLSYAIALWLCLWLSESALLVQGWWDEGHMTTAAVAYLDLSAEERELLDNELSLWVSEYPGMSSVPGSAVWADHIKCGHASVICEGLPAQDNVHLFNEWHFVEVMYNPEKLELSALEKLKPLPHNGALWAVEMLFQTLQHDRAYSPPERQPSTSVPQSTVDREKKKLNLLSSNATLSATQSYRTHFPPVPPNCQPMMPPSSVISPKVERMKVDTCPSKKCSIEVPNRHDLADSTGVASENIGSHFSWNLYLRLLIHIMGDLHQPLHCVERVTSLFPNGDRGGVDVKIESVEGIHNLHQLWDSMGNTATLAWPAFSKETSIDKARQLILAYPRSAFGERLQGRLNGADIQAIVEDSYRVGIEHIFTEISDPAFKNPYTPSTCYIAKVAELTRQQVTLGGYRLATLLKVVAQRLKLKREAQEIALQVDERELLPEAFRVR